MVRSAINYSTDFLAVSDGRGRTRTDGRGRTCTADGRQFLRPTPVAAAAAARWKAKGKMSELFLELCDGNLYTTTLHVINSAVVKLSQLTHIGKVYRGVSGYLPSSFCLHSESPTRDCDASTQAQKLLARFARYHVNKI